MQLWPWCRGHRVRELLWYLFWTGLKQNCLITFWWPCSSDVMSVAPNRGGSATFWDTQELWLHQTKLIHIKLNHSIKLVSFVGSLKSQLQFMNIANNSLTLQQIWASAVEISRHCEWQKAARVLIMMQSIKIVKPNVHKICCKTEEKDNVQTDGALSPPDRHWPGGLGCTNQSCVLRSAQTWGERGRSAQPRPCGTPGHQDTM